MESSGNDIIIYVLLIGQLSSTALSVDEIILPIHACCLVLF